MASVNKVILVGNLGRDPETRYNPEGGAITNISIATTDTWKDKASGEKQERTEWHRVVFFSRLAEIAGEYLKKGSQVYVEGSLRTRKWQDKEGKERTTTEIVAERMQMLGSGQPRGERARRRGRGQVPEETRGQVRRHGRRHPVLAASAPAQQQDFPDPGGVNQAFGQRQRFLKAHAQRHEHAVVQPHRPFAPVDQEPHTEVDQGGRSRLHPEHGAALHRETVPRQLGLQVSRLVAAPVTDEIVEACPLRGIERH